MQRIGIITKMSIRTSKNGKGQILSNRSPVRTLLSSEFQSAIKWLARRRDKTTNTPIGNVTQIGEIVKYEKDTFSLYGHTRHGQTVNINDVRGDAVFLRRLPDGKIDTSDHFLFCLGAGIFILTDWFCVWTTISKLTKDHGTVIYRDAWRCNKEKFLALLKKAISERTGKIRQKNTA